MVNKTADRPHSITIVLALIAAAVAAIGIWLNYQNHSAPTPSSVPVVSTVPPSLHTGNITQTTNGGAAVVGVQGNVTVNGGSASSKKQGNQK